jgi:hypothetical protein
MNGTASTCSQPHHHYPEDDNNKSFLTTTTTTTTPPKSTILPSSSSSSSRRMSVVEDMLFHFQLPFDIDLLLCDRKTSSTGIQVQTIYNTSCSIKEEVQKQKQQKQKQKQQQYDNDYDDPSHQPQEEFPELSSSTVPKSQPSPPIQEVGFTRMNPNDGTLRSSYPSTMHNVISNTNTNTNTNTNQYPSEWNHDDEDDERGGIVRLYDLSNFVASSSSSCANDEPNVDPNHFCPIKKNECNYRSLIRQVGYHKVPKTTTTITTKSSNPIMTQVSPPPPRNWNHNKETKNGSNHNDNDNDDMDDIMPLQQLFQCHEQNNDIILTTTTSSSSSSSSPIPVQQHEEVQHDMDDSCDAVGFPNNTIRNYSSQDDDDDDDENDVYVLFPSSNSIPISSILRKYHNDNDDDTTESSLSQNDNNNNTMPSSSMTTTRSKRRRHRRMIRKLIVLDCKWNETNVLIRYVQQYPFVHFDMIPSPTQSYYWRWHNYTGGPTTTNPTLTTSQNGTSTTPTATSNDATNRASENSNIKISNNDDRIATSSSSCISTIEAIYYAAYQVLDFQIYHQHHHDDPVVTNQTNRFSPYQQQQKLLQKLQQQQYCLLIMFYLFRHQRQIIQYQYETKQVQLYHRIHDMERYIPPYQKEAKQYNLSLRNSKTKTTKKT